MISVAPQIQKFQVRYSSTDIAGAAWTDITGSDHKTTGHTVTGLAGDTNYAFQVRAVNSDGNGSEGSKTQRTLNPALHAPGDFSATGASARSTCRGREPPTARPWSGTSTG